MYKLLISTMFFMLTYQVNAQIVIKRCPDGSTVGGNSSCPNRSSGNSIPVHKNYNVYGVIAADIVKGDGVSSSSRWQGEAAAKKGALDQCRERIGGVNNCEVLLTFKNVCGTVAATVDKEGKTIWAGGIGDTKEKAMDNAAIACNKKAARAGITKEYACGIWSSICAIDDRF